MKSVHRLCVALMLIAGFAGAIDFVKMYRTGAVESKFGHTDKVVAQITKTPTIINKPKTLDLKPIFCVAKARRKSHSSTKLLKGTREYALLTEIAKPINNEPLDRDTESELTATTSDSVADSGAVRAIPQ